MNKILPNKLFTFIIVNNFLYSCNAGVITKVELSKKLVDWQINLNDKKLTDCIQFIGEYRNELWILAKGGMFVNIDSTTGTVKGLIKNILQENIHGPIELFVKDNEGNRSPDDRNFYHLDQQKGKIIGESAKGIWEIDLTRPEPYLEVWGMEDQYNLHGLHDIGYKTVLQGDDLYFIDFNALKWGVIDVNNKKLKWVSEKITNAVTQLKEIQVAGNRAHILDGTKTLHVFEKLSA
ncbi:MAG: hypothetical protein K2U26_12645 [Cyclobacteriaceae bacterium]|nr:hypothetical protein [Cyclobacteriaceae bacterium]